MDSPSEIFRDTGNLLIRWTFGEWAQRPVHRQALSLLSTSIGFAKICFPKADFVLCCNNLNSTKSLIEDLSMRLGVALFDSQPFLPTYLQGGSAKNSWWKYAPPRLNPGGYELLLDNDVIIWKRPIAIDEWLHYGGLLSLGTQQINGRSKLYYGSYLQEVKAVNPYLDLNAGILGWPPGYEPPLEVAKKRNTDSEFFFSEQGFAALTFALNSGHTHLIPYTEVPLLHVMTAKATDLIARFSGGHFCQSTYGELTYWEDTYEKVVVAHLRDRTQTNTLT